MLIQFRFIFYIMRLAPLCLIIRGFLLLSIPGIRRRTTVLHEAGVLAFWLYLAAVCYQTVNIVRVLHGHFEMGSHYNLTPLAGIREVAASADRMYVLLNIVGNVVMFVPLGFLLPLLWRRWRGARVFLVSVLLSSGIEVLQFFTGRGTDVDDVLLNTLGGVCGYLGFLMVRDALPGVTGRFRVSERDRNSPAVKPPMGQRPVMPRPSHHTVHPIQSAKAIHRQPRQRRGNRGAALFATTVVLCALLSGTVLLSGVIRPSALAGSFAEEVAPPIPGLSSTNALLVAGDRILYEKNADQRIYPASMTKIMTAILILEQMEDLQQPVYLREELFSDIHSANLATAGFLPGEVVRAMDLLYGLMLPSGAECAVGLAEHLSGSERIFSTLMNAKAGELGMRDTHFTNATGRHQGDHYTTVADIVLLMQYALENPAFRAIASSQSHTTAPTNLHPEGITFYSTLLGSVEETAFPAGELLGGKTGYTDEAGQCLASFARVGGEELVLVTAGGRPADFRIEQLHIDDALAIYSALS